MVLDSVYSTVLRRYVHGAGVDEPVLWWEGSGTADGRSLLADRQGSVVATAPLAGGTSAVSLYTYGPYGERTSWGGSRFAYTGQIALPEASLYHYKARAYDPARGWFLQTDPIGYEAGDFNLYAYVGGDPVDKADPSGRVPWLVSRPTGWGGTDHMFVVDAPTLGGKIEAQFSFGPSQGVGGQLTSQPPNSSIYKEDQAYWSMLSDPKAAKVAGVSATQINASDATVKGLGKTVNGILGPPTKPGSVPYSAVPTTGNAANSNAAAYAIANGATRSENPSAPAQQLPPGARAPGWGQADRVLPGTGAPPPPPPRPLICRDKAAC